MRVIVTGAKGQLGDDVVRELCRRNHEAYGSDIEDMDITSKEDVSQGLKLVMPHAVIHCAAWTAVDAAEEMENRDQVKKVNAVGTKNLAEACKEIGAKMLYVSTDYVFQGVGDRPWEPEDDREPINIYGQSKYEGEVAVEQLLEKYYIVRIAWVFGRNGKNFVKTMLRLGKKTNEISVVNDQIGTPTYTKDLARLLVDMIETDAYGHYHATNEGGYISWYEFAVQIMQEASRLDPQYETVNVKPVSSAEYPSKAKRPYNSRLDKKKLVECGFTPLPDWRDALKRYIREVFETEEL